MSSTESITENCVRPDGKRSFRIASKRNHLLDSFQINMILSNKTHEHTFVMRFKWAVIPRLILISLTLPCNFACWLHALSRIFLGRSFTGDHLTCTENYLGITFIFCWRERVYFTSLGPSLILLISSHTHKHNHLFFLCNQNSSIKC